MIALLHHHHPHPCHIRNQVKTMLRYSIFSHRFQDARCLLNVRDPDGQPEI
ncbi:hypothetical protein HanIR_Chr11g0521141 [Helianthus annuus]|nr:hypothetical protein HanIR_Chr11g0521141 [Helianthus annuus]